MGRKILADAGYEVITVNNGSAALKKIAELKPDLIVLDVYMPGYSGLEVCQRLKESQETARLPVLLTVGKLEPFKPEEAKRVRADGFIVKPFEASELLSALSKLEDKIIPRGETSKPGRFARSTAAIEDGRYDKSVALDEDSGWRNRIAFPSQKKEKAAQEDGGDQAIYNAMNKDVRTVVEHKLADQPHEAMAQEARVDLGALAPEGLPKDVTPEEIAALAAAAAQVKGKIAESLNTETAPSEGKTEQTAEAKDKTQAAEVRQEIAAVQPPVATFAEQKSENKIEVYAETSSTASKESASAAAPSPADVMAAIAGLESVSDSGNGSRSHHAADQAADEPITMAFAAGAGSGAAGSRWTAVSVALAPEEASISLEHEMQKAYAAFAAAESGHAGIAAASLETQAASTETSAHVEATAPEPIVAVPASPAPEAVQSLSAVASAATEAITAAETELEAAAASYVAEKTSISAEPELVPVEQAGQVVSEASRTFEAENGHEARNQEKEHEPSGEAPTPVAAAELEGTSKTIVEAAATFNNEISPKPTSEDPSSILATDPANVPQGESDVVETTAAAWASWRRIRESGVAKDASVESSQKEIEAAASGVPDAAVMAVAAGAEKHPEESSASESDPEGIASIVDSVLADLRPKIFEEISRKMAKKK